MTNIKKVYELKEAQLKIEQYCVYQDRCHFEVEEKLKSYGLIELSVDVIMESLIENKFLDEERFARSFTRGSYRHKKWGWNKIKMHLKNKRLTSYCIKKGKEEIILEEYLQMIEYELSKKWKSITGKSHYEKVNKLTRFGISRGYEYEFITNCFDELFKEE